MRNGLLIAAVLCVLASSASAQVPTFPSPLPLPDSLPTLRYGSDLSNLTNSFNPTEYFPLARLRRLGPGSVEAPSSYTGYGNVEYLWWWTRDQRPPLLFTQPEAHDVGGRLPYDNQERTGMRATLGWWLNNNQTLGIEATYLHLWRREPSLLLGPVLTRPNDEVVGAANLSNFSRLWGAEINCRAELARWTGGHLDVLAGIRHFQLEENLDVAALGVDGIVVHDRFSSHNQFWGAQLGLQGEVNWGPLSVDVFGKIGLGVNHQVTDVEGNRIVNDQTTPGGFYAQSSNIGRHVRDPFALLPEVGLHVAYRLTDTFRLTAGYSILWLTHAGRPGEQLDARQSQQLGGGRPTFQSNDSTFWAQGLSVGLEFRW